MNYNYVYTLSKTLVEGASIDQSVHASVCNCYIINIDPINKEKYTTYREF